MDEQLSLNTPELLTNNEAHAASFEGADLPAAPARRVAIVACMDARLDVSRALGLRNGDAHVIRNAGGVVTDDVIRSLCLSQRALGTREIMLIHHTKCGVQGLDEAALRADLVSEVGVAPTWSVETFADVEEDVRQSMRRLEASPFVPYTDHMRGFVYDVDTGHLIEVLADENYR